MRMLEGSVGWCKVSWRHEMVWLCRCKVCLVRVWRGEGSSIWLRGRKRSDSLNSNSRTGVVVSVLIPGCPHSTNSILEQSTKIVQSIKNLVTNCQSFCCWGRNKQSSFLHVFPKIYREKQSSSRRPKSIELGGGYSCWREGWSGKGIVTVSNETVATLSTKGSCLETDLG